jgi:hypothetical protein
MDTSSPPVAAASHGCTSATAYDRVSPGARLSSISGVIPAAAATTATQAKESVRLHSQSRASVPSCMDASQLEASEPRPGATYCRPRDSSPVGCPVQGARAQPRADDVGSGAPAETPAAPMWLPSQTARSSTTCAERADVVAEAPARRRGLAVERGRRGVELASNSSRHALASSTVRARVWVMCSERVEAGLRLPAPDPSTSGRPAARAPRCWPRSAGRTGRPPRGRRATGS